jgi:hypothetical protein
MKELKPVKAYKPYPLLHRSGTSNPVMFKSDLHESYAAWLHYPIFLDVDSKTVRIAIDFMVIAPRVFVKESIPYELSYPISEVYWQ